MTTAFELMGIQDAPDGPGPLAESDRGVTLVWDGSRFVAMQPAANAGTQIRVARGGGATRLQDAPDFTGAVGAGTDGYAIVWDNAAGAFTLGTFEASGAAAAAIAAHVGESDPHTQYLLAGGSRAGATDGLQAFEDGIVTGIVRPPSDSATALRVQNAAGTTDMLVVDTQNGRVGVLSTFSASTFNIASNAGDTYASYLSQERALLLNGYENLSPASLSNSAGFEFRLQTSLTARTAGRLSAGYTDITDATRTSYYAFSLSVSGIFKEVLRLAGGNVGIGTATPTAILDVSAATTTNASMRIRAGVAPTSPNDGDIWKNTDEFVMHGAGSNTNTILNTLRLRRGSSGTPAAGFGSALNWQMKSSTTAGQDAGRIYSRWNVATHASRAADMVHTVYFTSTEQEFLRGRGDTGGVQLGFYGVTPVARQLLATGAGATVDQVITLLQNVGLARQS